MKLHSRELGLKYSFAAFLLLILMSASIKVVHADVPDVLQVENISQGSLAKIRVQIRHASPSSNHYVDKIEATASAGGYSVPFTFTSSPQSTNPFIVEFGVELGQFSVPKADVKVRAHCTLHGWSAWSNQIEIPEFNSASITAIAALVSCLLIARKTKKQSRRAHTHAKHLTK